MYLNVAEKFEVKCVPSLTNENESLIPSFVIKMGGTQRVTFEGTPKYSFFYPNK